MKQTNKQSEYIWFRKRGKRIQITSYDICFIHTVILVPYCLEHTIGKIWSILIRINDDIILSSLTLYSSVLVVNSFASYYKNRMWRNEVYLKKRERLRHNVVKFYFKNDFESLTVKNFII
jgi:hypothetical protein